ncbi:MAG: GspE/PulE family protein [Candidatus Jettenia sp.]|nr:GspE/PulE family protein [Candidatus Jettenia sp.]
MRQEEVDDAVQFIRSSKTLGGEDIFINLGYTVQDETAKISDSPTGLPSIELTNVDLTPEILQSVPEDMVRRHLLVPVNNEDGMVTIALSNPPNSTVLDDIRFFIGQKVKFVMAEKDHIEGLIQRYYSNSMDLVSAGLQQTVRRSTEPVLSYDDDTIVELVNTMISDAISMNASDIHIEPLETRLRVRYRVDDFCYEVNSFEKRLQPMIISRIKVMAGLDLAEKRLPQDGRAKIQQSGIDVSIRVSTLPVIHGEGIVLRILDKSNVRKGLRTLGLLEEDYNQLSSIVAIPDGMMIISGPTGSGKTTTLYAMLNELMSPEIKIITIEDPVEYTLDGVNQIQVSAEHGRGFSRILKHILRHDPNVIMVGEMRDLESVEIAMRSSLTGHKVMSTLHTNDAPSVITRLINIGLPPFMINASVQAVIYQRLVRTLCKKCRIPFKPAEDEVVSWMRKEGEEEFDGSWYVEKDAMWFSPAGCKECNFSGYKGRIALFEIMTLNEEIKELTKKGASSMAIRKAALEQGMRAIRVDGIRKAMKGITSIYEVLRVT